MALARPPSQNGRSPEERWPALSLAYEFVRPSYEQAGQRLEVVEARIRSLLAFAVSATFATPALAIAVWRGKSRSAIRLVLCRPRACGSCFSGRPECSRVGFAASYRSAAAVRQCALVRVRLPADCALFCGKRLPPEPAVDQQEGINLESGSRPIPRRRPLPSRVGDADLLATLSTGSTFPNVDSKFDRRWRKRVWRDRRRLRSLRLIRRGGGTTVRCGAFRWCRRLTHGSFLE